ncbi:MAG TPA: class I SAM-dependent methyltransferase [Chroococcales cyanobacterium]
MLKKVKELVRGGTPAKGTQGEAPTTTPEPAKLSNLEYNKKIWDGYAKWWTKEGVNLEDKSVSAADKDEYLKYLGDEWGVAKDVDQIVEQYIYPYISPQMVAGEIGTGGGRVAAKVVDRVQTFYCFDISVEMLNKCQEALAGHDNVKYVLLEDCRFGSDLNNKFGFVYAFDVFVHLDLHNMWKYLKGYNKILKEGGHAFVHTANLKAPGGWERFAAQEAYAVEGHYFMCPEMIEILAQKAGFEVVKTSTPEPSNFYLNRDYLAVLKKVRSLD